MASIAYGQAVQTQPGIRSYEPNKANVDDAIAKVKSGNFLAVDLDVIRRGGAVEAIPILKEQFVRVQEPLLKGKIASVLIRLGSDDDTYWDFLVRLAAPALGSDAPDFMSYDSQGRSVPGPSLEFSAWAKAHNVAANGPKGTTAEDSVYIFPAEVALLGTTRDPRAIPLLRRGLLSPNHMVEIMAANGLAEIQDKDSIPLIIEACKRAPVEAARAIAESLVYFDDRAAQSAVDTYIPRDRAQMLRAAKAQGKKTPFTY